MTGREERFVSVASELDVPAGEVVVVRAEGRSLCLAHCEDGSWGAIDNVCTHDGGPLGEGTLRAGRVICPRHGAAFDARTGRVLSLPAVRSVQAYPVSVEGDGIYIDCETVQ